MPRLSFSVFKCLMHTSQYCVFMPVLFNNLDKYLFTETVKKGRMQQDVETLTNTKEDTKKIILEQEKLKVEIEMLKTEMTL